MNQTAEVSRIFNFLYIQTEPTGSNFNEVEGDRMRVIERARTHACRISADAGGGWPGGWRQARKSEKSVT